MTLFAKHRLALMILALVSACGLNPQPMPPGESSTESSGTPSGDGSAGKQRPAASGDAGVSANQADGSAALAPALGQSTSAGDGGASADAALSAPVAALTDASSESASDGASPDGASDANGRTERDSEGLDADAADGGGP